MFDRGWLTGGSVASLFVIILGVLAFLSDKYLPILDFSKLAALALVALLVCAITVPIGQFILGCKFDSLYELNTLNEKKDGLVQTIADMEARSKEFRIDAQKALPDEAVKIYERGAILTRIVSPDLEDDQNDFFSTILDNIEMNREYEYIIPKIPKIQHRMNELKERLVSESKKYSSVEELPITVHELDLEIPLVNAFGIYKLKDGFEKNNPFFANERPSVGVMEINIAESDEDGSYEKKITHVKLTPDATDALNGWFNTFSTNNRESEIENTTL